MTEKPKRAKLEVRVTRIKQITPHYRRIFFTGENLSLLEDATLGDNNKTLFPPEGVKEIHFPDFDPVKKEWKPIPPELKPAIRTLTHKGLDLSKKEIWVDFILHGDTGIASAWATHAKEGDLLGIMMKTRPDPLFPPAGHYFLAGDHSALPVLSSLLESLPKEAKGHCILEVPGKEDEQPLKTKAAISFTWLHNSDPQNGSEIAKVFKSLPLPDNDRFAYIAAEYRTVKELRNYLRKDKGWKGKELYAYSYWKAGVEEDRSVDDRRKERDRM